ncbi:MAG: sigma-70 family RNA polymerase sigma factor [Bacteroidia bacterium]|nr:sigma-70 family RNA polymerase sigma factor [Bacteroidia bacterium]
MDAQTYKSYQSLLFPIAYNMLGSQDDADDLVQETLIKWLDVDKENIENQRAYLVRILVNKCLNFLRSRQKEQLEEAPESNETVTMPFRVDHPFSLSISFKLMLSRLSPMERAVFLLKDVFSFSHKEIAEMLNISQENCRQILVRARRHLKKDKERYSVAPQHHRELVNTFMEVVEGEDLGQLLELLKEDIELDILKPAAQLSMKGRFRVGEYLRRPTYLGYKLKLIELNGVPTLVWYNGKEAILKLDIFWEGEEIQRIESEEIALLDFPLELDYI